MALQHYIIIIVIWKYNDQKMCMHNTSNQRWALALFTTANRKLQLMDVESHSPCSQNLTVTSIQWRDHELQKPFRYVFTQMKKRTYYTLRVYVQQFYVAIGQSFHLEKLHKVKVKTIQ